MITALGALLVASLFTVGQDQSGIILQYFLTVHLYGFIREFLETVTKNVSRMHLSLTLFPGLIDFSSRNLSVLSDSLQSSLCQVSIGGRLVELIARGEVFLCIKLLNSLS